MKYKVVCLISIISSTLLVNCSKPTVSKKRPVNVYTQRPKRQTMPIYFEVPGHIEPYKAVKIIPQVSGKVMSINYEEGTFVREGDLLSTIDDRPFVAQLERNEALLLENRAKLKYAEDTYIRNKPLVSDDYISKEQFENLGTNVSVLKAAIEQNLAEIESAKINVEYCYIKAPISGITGNKLIDLGNIVSKDSDNSTLVTINQITPVYGSFYLPAKDLAPVIAARQSASSSLQVLLSYNDDFTKAFVGDLVFIDNAIDEKTGMILLKGLFPNKTQTLWPGQFVNVRLILRHEKNALVIPSQAIQQNSKGFYVYVIKNNKAQMRMITPGQREDNLQIIEKGLTEEDDVVIKGQLDLFPDATATIQNQEDV